MWEYRRAVEDRRPGEGISKEGDFELVFASAPLSLPALSLSSFSLSLSTSVPDLPTP